MWLLADRFSNFASRDGVEVLWKNNAKKMNPPEDDRRVRQRLLQPWVFYGLQLLASFVVSIHECLMFLLVSYSTSQNIGGTLRSLSFLFWETLTSFTV